MLIPMLQNVIDFLKCAFPINQTTTYIHTHTLRKNVGKIVFVQLTENSKTSKAS